MDYSLAGSSAHGISRQEYWSGLLFPPPGDPLIPRIEPVSLLSSILVGGFFASWVTGKPPTNKMVVLFPNFSHWKPAAKHWYLCLCSWRKKQVSYPREQKALKQPANTVEIQPIITKWYVLMVVFVCVHLFIKLVSIISRNGYIGNFSFFLKIFCAIWIVYNK